MKLNQEQLQELRDADAGLGESLQFYTPIYQQRRELLAHVTEVETETATLTSELSLMLEPFSAGVKTLPELVERMRYAQQVRAEVQASIAASMGVPPSFVYATETDVPVTLPEQFTGGKRYNKYEADPVVSGQFTGGDVL